MDFKDTELIVWDNTNKQIGFVESISKEQFHSVLVNYGHKRLIQHEWKTNILDPSEITSLQKVKLYCIDFYYTWLCPYRFKIRLSANLSLKPRMSFVEKSYQGIFKYKYK